MSNKFWQLAGFLAGMSGRALPSINLGKTPKDEVWDVCQFLKCSPEELYEKCKKNKKLLSKHANEFLKNHIERMKGENDG